jgi:proteic killer suppression protein
MSLCKGFTFAAFSGQALGRINFINKSCISPIIYLSLALVTQLGSMIKSFGSRETEKIWEGSRSTRLPLEIQNIGRRKLRMLNNSVTIIDLRIPPSNRLEKLTGKRKDYHSIRINDQWRIIFKWHNGHSFDVEIIDYHK